MVQKVIGGTPALTAAAQLRYANVFGKNVVAAGEPLNEDGQNWGLVAEWPTSEADAVINALLLRDAIMLLVVFGLVLLSVVLALIIVRPIEKLEEGTARVAQGKFNEGVSITTGDELEELGDSFNDMVMGLKQLEQLKDEFVFIAAHELRTPVAAMKGYLELILDGTTGVIPDATRAFIEKVIASNQRLIQLVNDLLEVARSQAGRLLIKVAPVDIAPAISSTIDELKSLADEKGVTMTYAPGMSPLPHVLADADRIKEVVVNLVGNAIKYMGGAGTITITQETCAGGQAAHARRPRSSRDARHAHRGHRHRHVRGGAAKIVPKILSCADGQDEGYHGHRPRPFHREGNNREDGWHDRGGVRGGERGARSASGCRWRMGCRIWWGQIKNMKSSAPPVFFGVTC